MPNDSSLDARQASTHAGTTGDKYKVLCSHMTQVLTDADKTRVIYYETPVVTFDESKIVLNTGGWWTPTTQVRMNQASREFGLGFRVFQKARDWFVEYQRQIYPFVADELMLRRTDITQEGGEKDEY